MKIGVTGTRHGLTEFQATEIADFLQNQYVAGAELHHGDCVGADVEVAEIAKHLGYKIVCHPPANKSLRGNFPSDETRTPLTYFERNRNIVDETECLIVAPYQKEWQPNGGTWYTHDYAKKKNKPLILCYPDTNDVRYINGLGVYG